MTDLIKQYNAFKKYEATLLLAGEELTAEHEQKLADKEEEFLSQLSNEELEYLASRPNMLSQARNYYKKRIK